jgi:hypothetical protein
MIYTIDVPVEIGQTVYKLGNFYKIVETKVEAIVVRAEGTYVKLECNSVYETSLKTLGRTWWLTLEDAVNYVENKKSELQNKGRK